MYTKLLCQRIKPKKLSDRILMLTTLVLWLTFHQNVTILPKYTNTQFYKDETPETYETPTKYVRNT